ncbi:MAG: MBL fold metallo-hydrolase [Ruminococcaceae bacterium]|nr:MBL fold metallo-hydrolase [Oscillospiraceae bacterium]
MLELIHVKGNSYYFASPAKIGLYRISETDVVLIDSGNDASAAKRVLRTINERGWRLVAIYNTHSHADHIGGNAYLQKNTGCRVFAKGLEAAYTNYPILEPLTLFGAYPPKELRHKFLLAEASVAEPLSDAVLPQGLSLLPLSGHAMDMVGFLTDDGVAFLGDALSSQETLDKYKICYIYDIASYLETLRGLPEIAADIYVPSHAAPTEDIAPLAQYNTEATLAVAEDIVALLATPKHFESLFSLLLTQYGAPLNFQQYGLVGSTLRSYLAWLKNERRIDVIFENNFLCWKAI